MNPPIPATVPPSIRSPRTFRRPAAWRLALLAGVLAATTGVGQAQDRAVPDWSDTADSGWTGNLQNAREARKEAGAALAQGRRECGRSKGESRSTCLKKVQDDYAETVKRLQTSGGAKR